METKAIPTSGYLEEKYCEQLRELLRDAMQRKEKDKPLPNFYATHQEYERKMFAIIDNAKESLCDDCDEGSQSEDVEVTEAHIQARER